MENKTLVSPLNQINGKKVGDLLSSIQFRLGLVRETTAVDPDDLELIDIADRILLHSGEPYFDDQPHLGDQPDIQIAFIKCGGRLLARIYYNHTTDRYFRPVTSPEDVLALIHEVEKSPRTQYEVEGFRKMVLSWGKEVMGE